MFKTSTLAATLILGSALAAQAALVDFTDSSSYTISGATGSGSAAGFSYDLSATGGNFNNSETGNFPAGSVGPLLGSVDGLGIGDDEISTPTQSVTIDFSTNVVISSIFALDLFASSLSTDGLEGFSVTSDTGDSVMITAEGIVGDTIGFSETSGLALSGTSFTFTPGSGNDGTGAADFALAGFVAEAAVVPLPASMLLLGGALGGIGLVARRNKKRKAA